MTERSMKALNPAVARVLKRVHYPLDVILTCVRCCARILLVGIELMYMIAKGQMQCTRATHPSAADQFHDLAT